MTETVTLVRVPAVGDRLEPRVFGPITRTDIVRYAGASGDFNPVHHDQTYAEKSGFSTVFSIGMYQAALLATFATDWLGAYAIRRFAVRFSEQVWPGDELTCSGVVTTVDHVDESIQLTADLTCHRQTGGVAVRATASFVLEPEGDQ